MHAKLRKAKHRPASRPAVAPVIFNANSARTSKRTSGACCCGSSGVLDDGGWYMYGQIYIYLLYVVSVLCTVGQNTVWRCFEPAHVHSSLSQWKPLLPRRPRDASEARCQLAAVCIPLLNASPASQLFRDRHRLTPKLALSPALAASPLPPVINSDAIPPSSLSQTMPSLPIDIYNHGSRLLGSLKGYYLKEAGRSSPPPIPP